MNAPNIISAYNQISIKLTFDDLISGPTDPQSIDPKLLLSYGDKFWCCCPERCREPLRCGVDYTELDVEVTHSDVIFDAIEYRHRVQMLILHSTIIA